MNQALSHNNRGYYDDAGRTRLQRLAAVRRRLRISLRPRVVPGVAMTGDKYDEKARELLAEAAAKEFAARVVYGVSPGGGGFGTSQAIAHSYDVAKRALRGER